MDVLPAGETLGEQIRTLAQARADYDFFFFHIKKTDAKGEDGDFDGKVAALEEIDRSVPEILAPGFDTAVFTGDHSTPSLLKSHSWHPVPFALLSPSALPDSVTRFTERDCAKGILGRFPAVEAMFLMLAHSGKLQKFGA